MQIQALKYTGDVSVYSGEMYVNVGEFEFGVFVFVFVFVCGVTLRKTAQGERDCSFQRSEA
jgi:hypothetical protein